MLFAKEIQNLETAQAAKFLLGQKLVRQIGKQLLVGKIVETEAYLGQKDIASHSYNGETPRNSVMFGPPGHAYVYSTYGMHYCFNVVTSSAGNGEAVLIRAVEPLEGMEIMRQNRQLFLKSPSRTVLDAHNLSSGPAKLCQALRIDKSLNGHNLANPPLRLELASKLAPKIVTTTRIGITQNRELPLRFYIKDSDYVSRK